MMRNKYMKNIIFLVLVKISIQINQTCSDVSECSGNSQCSQGYCHCLVPYILDCEIQSQILTSHYQNYAITNQSKYFTVYPESIDVFASYTFSACYQPIMQLDKYELRLLLFAEIGASILTKQAFIGSQTISLDELFAYSDQNQNCDGFAQFQVRLQYQPNGDPEYLIAQISIYPLSQSDQNDNAIIQIQLNVEIRQIISNDTLLKLAIGIVATTGIAVLCSIIFCCYRKWKTRINDNKAAELKHYQIQHLKQQIPQVVVGTLNIASLSTCSICLGQFLGQQMVRKLVCSHIFHTPCIDSWCLKNLNCPICRFQLDEESIKNRKKQLMDNSHYKWQNNKLSEQQQVMVNNFDSIYTSEIRENSIVLHDDDHNNVL